MLQASTPMQLTRVSKQESISEPDGKSSLRLPTSKWATRRKSILLRDLGVLKRTSSTHLSNCVCVQQASHSSEQDQTEGARRGCHPEPARPAASCPNMDRRKLWSGQAQDTTVSLIGVQSCAGTPGENDACQNRHATPRENDANTCNSKCSGRRTLSQSAHLRFGWHSAGSRRQARPLQNLAPVPGQKLAPWLVRLAAPLQLRYSLQSSHKPHTAQA